MKQIGQGINRIGTLAVALTAGFVGSALAQQDGTWTGGGTDNNWLNAANWVDGVVAGNWNSALFSSGVVNGSVNNNSYQGHRAITVDASCPMDIAIGGIKIPKDEAPITVTGANLTFNTDLNAWSPQTFVVAAGKTLTFNARINQDEGNATGSSVTMNGEGTVVMTRAGLYTGGTILNGGTLKTLTANGIGPGPMTVGAGTTWDRSPARQTVGGLAGAGHVTRISNGVLSTGPDGSTQISASKNYVYALDFEPNGGGGATVNGVKFSGVGTSGPGWSLTGTANIFNEDPGQTGYGRLLSGFYYGGTGTLTFNGLIVGRTYEVVVFSSPGWGYRPQNATFTNGSDSHQMLNTNPGDNGYYAYAFLATDPTVTVTMAPLTAATYHWYGATLELSPPLTVGNANDYRFEGLIDGDTSLVKQGSGVQTLAAANPYAGGTAVKAGTLTTTASGAVGAGAVDVASGATWKIWDGAHQTVAGLSGAGTVEAFSGAVSTGADGAAQISIGKNYIQKLDFGNGAGAEVNGVTFDNVSNNSGTGWLLGGATAPYFADGGSGYDQLMSDFLYGGNPGVLTFYNLTIGKCYDIVLYTKIGVWGYRWQNATFANGPDSIQLINTDPGTVGYYSYQFEAKAETATVTMVPINPGNSFHWFAASLEALPPAAVNLFTNGVTLTLGDAQNRRFEGAINGAVSLVKQGSGTQTLAGPVAYTGSTTVNDGTLKLELPSPPEGTVTLDNASFETHDALANGTWGYNPTGATWTFDTTSGIAAPGTPWVATGAALDGSYAAYIQNYGVISQAVTVAASGTYKLTFKAANRPGFSASGLNLMVDGVISSSFPASAFNSQGMFQTFTAFAKINAGTHTLAFAGDKVGGDSATAVDGISSLSGIGGSLSTNSTVSIAFGAWLDLGGTTQTVSRLYFDGNEKQPGTHGAVGSGAMYPHANWFTGTGMLNVLNGKFSGTMIILL